MEIVSGVSLWSKHKLPVSHKLDSCETMTVHFSQKWQAQFQKNHRRRIVDLCWFWVCLATYVRFHRPYIHALAHIHCYVASRLMNSRGYMYQPMVAPFPQTQTDAYRTRYSCSTCTPLPRLSEWDYVCCVVCS